MRRVMYMVMLLLLLTLIVQAAEVQTTVKYVSVGTIYLDSGRSQGIAVGDSVRIYRDDLLLAGIVVTFVADNSAACELPEGTTRIEVGDAASVDASKRIDIPEAVAIEDAVIIVEEPVRNIDSDRDSRTRNRLSGRIAAEYFVQDDREAFNYDYTQPSLSTRLRLSEINGSHFSASVKARLRKTYRDRETSAATNSSSSSRIYEATLRYENPDSRLEYGIGRLIARELRGIGYLDGGYGKYELSSMISMGVFAGTEPDLETTDFQTGVVKGGVFTSYDSRLSAGSRLTATLSFAGVYEAGEIEREFIYQQVSYSYGSRFRIYESTEINLYRGWLKDKEGTNLGLASLLLNSRYDISRMIAVSLGYDNRQSFYTYSARSVPDSLFDDALRQGWRGSVDLIFTNTISGVVGAGLRSTEGDQEDAKSGWVHLRVRDVLRSRINISIQVRTFTNQFSDGFQPSLSISRPVVSRLYAALQVGANSYTLSSSKENIEQTWIRPALNFEVDDHLYGSIEGEAARGSNRNSNVMSLIIGYRL